MAVVLGTVVAVGAAFLCYRLTFAILMRLKDGIVPELPTGFWLATAGYDFLVALLGGVVAAWIGGRRPGLHGAAVGAVLIGLTYASMASASGDEPTWFFPAAMFVGFLGGISGGWLRGRLR